MAARQGTWWMGLITAGLGAGVALALPTGVASADSSGNWWQSIDTFFTGAAASTPDLNLAISFDGMTLLSDGTAKATTEAGDYGFAIAYGDGANASAVGGIGNFALAAGNNAAAAAGGLSGDTGNNGDIAVDIGNNDPMTDSNLLDGAFAGNTDLPGNTTGLFPSPGGDGGSNDIAIDIGNNYNDDFDGGGLEGAFAGEGSYTQPSGDHNIAIDIGNNTGQDNGASADAGSYNYASDVGNNTGFSNGAFSVAGDHNTAVADTNYSGGYLAANAGGGNDNLATVLGPDNSTAIAAGSEQATGSNDNVAYVLDPFGTTASSATSGGSDYLHQGSFNFAELLFSDGQANATDSNFLYDFLTLFGHESGTFPSFISTLLTDLAPLF